jgi:hypothetical protein
MTRPHTQTLMVLLAAAVKPNEASGGVGVLQRVGHAHRAAPTRTCVPSSPKRRTPIFETPSTPAAMETM